MTQSSFPAAFKVTSCHSFTIPNARLVISFTDGSLWSVCEWFQNGQISFVISDQAGGVRRMDNSDGRNGAFLRATLENCDVVIKESSLLHSGLWECRLTAASSSDDETVAYDVLVKSQYGLSLEQREEVVGPGMTVRLFAITIVASILAAVVFILIRLKMHFCTKIAIEEIAEDCQDANSLGETKMNVSSVQALDDLSSCTSSLTKTKIDFAHSDEEDPSSSIEDHIYEVPFVEPNLYVDASPEGQYSSLDFLPANNPSMEGHYSPAKSSRSDLSTSSQRLPSATSYVSLSHLISSAQMQKEKPEEVPSTVI